ncbi:GNAT family N-acetyltransferase [Streptococcus suis]|nr:GNAT family N-acetyltransferase [Streptococcus suis]
MLAFHLPTTVDKEPEKAGFRLEGIKRDSQKTADGYADTLIMSILEDEWKALKKPAD